MVMDDVGGSVCGFEFGKGSSGFVEVVLKDWY